MYDPHKKKVINSLSVAKLVTPKPKPTPKPIPKPTPKPQPKKVEVTHYVKLSYNLVTFIGTSGEVKINTIKITKTDSGISVVGPRFVASEKVVNLTTQAGVFGAATTGIQVSNGNLDAKNSFGIEGAGGHVVVLGGGIKADRNLNMEGNVEIGFGKGAKGSLETPLTGLYDKEIYNSGEIPIFKDPWSSIFFQGNP